jgi:hypothetical protein
MRLELEQNRSDPAPPRLNRRAGGAGGAGAHTTHSTAHLHHYQYLCAGVVCCEDNLLQKRLQHHLILMLCAAWRDTTDGQTAYVSGTYVCVSRGGGGL